MEVPQHGFQESGNKTVTLELSEANAQRVANAVNLAGIHIIDSHGHQELEAAEQSFALSQEIKRQLRESKE